MKEGELNILATHLGHDAKTHNEYYRLSSATVELTTVCVQFYYIVCLHSHEQLIHVVIVITGSPAKFFVTLLTMAH